MDQVQIDRYRGLGLYLDTQIFYTFYKHFSLGGKTFIYFCIFPGVCWRLTILFVANWGFLKMKKIDLEKWLQKVLEKRRSREKKTAKRAAGILV